MTPETVGFSTQRHKRIPELTHTFLLFLHAEESLLSQFMNQEVTWFVVFCGCGLVV